MAKVELTLKIDGKVAGQLKHEGPLDIQVIGEASSMITTKMMTAMQEEQAEELAAANEAEREAARIEAEAENADRS